MNLPLQNERDLLDGMAQGDRLATETVYRLHKKPLLLWLRKNGAEETDAEEIFQEAMVILFEKAQDPAFRLSCRIGTYLTAIGKNLWLKRLDARTRSQIFLRENLSEIDQADYNTDIRIQQEREIHYQLLGQALGKLGQPCQGLLTAFYMEQKSMLEIAQQFGYANTDHAKTQKYKCLTRLRKIFFSEKV